MTNLTKQQANVLQAISQMQRVDRPWLPMSTLDSFDGRTTNSLINKGAIEVDFEYGVRAK